MSSIGVTLHRFAEWIASDEAKCSYMNWLKSQNEDNEESTYISTSLMNDAPTHYDAKLLYKIDDNGWLNNEFYFNFSIAGRCVSLTYQHNIYQRTQDDDIRNGEADGMYFYRTLYDNTGEQIYEKVRVWPDDYTIITIRRADKNTLTGWQLVNRFYI